MKVLCCWESSSLFPIWVPGIAKPLEKRHLGTYHIYRLHICEALFRDSLFDMIYIFFSCTSSTFIYFSFVLVLLLKFQIRLLCVMTFLILFSSLSYLFYFGPCKCKLWILWHYMLRHFKIYSYHGCGILGGIIII